jgi:Arc/MetJ-type ribon-helix-helix transcriptional regulator
MLSDRRGKTMAADDETLTIMLPVELMERVRMLVDAGTFASENEAILSAIQEASEWHRVPETSHASLEAMLGELPEQFTQAEQDEESV